MWGKGHAFSKGSLKLPVTPDIFNAWSAKLDLSPVDCVSDCSLFYFAPEKFK